MLLDTRLCACDLGGRVCYENSRQRSPSPERARGAIPELQFRSPNILVGEQRCKSLHKEASWNECGGFQCPHCRFLKSEKMGRSCLDDIDAQRTEDNPEE
uniref:Uncharacterized protein n=1 Tax=Proboscia inermis TaxID=420281 RepID=A0A7S0GC61_9STRA|mmetsp:Transcript_19502/g.19798  ORF Transcript_19502/g.19798 Transcript_19502/m.19798 type:complete len:100 (+) Transcript_19502:344-643(+)